MKELDKRLVIRPYIALVVLHVVGLYVGNDRHHWQQMQERGIALISLNNQIIARKGVLSPFLLDNSRLIYL